MNPLQEMLNAQWGPSVVIDLLRYALVLMAGGLVTVVIRELRADSKNLRDKCILLSWLTGTLLFSLEGIARMGEETAVYKLPLMLLSVLFGCIAIFVARPVKAILLGNTEAQNRAEDPNDPYNGEDSYDEGDGKEKI